MPSAQVRSARLLIALLFIAPLAAHAADTCGLLTRDQVAKATQDSIRSATPGPENCTWAGKDATLYISVRDSATWATGKSAFQKYGQIQAVPGIGEDAFFQDPDDPKPTFYALKGSHFIVVRLSVKGFSTDQIKAGLQALATEALAKL